MTRKLLKTFMTLLFGTSLAVGAYAGGEPLHELGKGEAKDAEMTEGVKAPEEQKIEGEKATEESMKAEEKKPVEEEQKPEVPAEEPVK